MAWCCPESYRCRPCEYETCGIYCPCQHITTNPIVGEPIRSNLSGTRGPCGGPGEPDSEFTGCDTYVACDLSGGGCCAHPGCEAEGRYGYCCIQDVNTGCVISVDIMSRRLCLAQLPDFPSCPFIQSSARFTKTWTSQDPPPPSFCLNPCGPDAPSCCGCDWCCDNPIACEQLREFGFENLPVRRDEPCNGTQCARPAPRPLCRRAEFAIGKRPFLHEPSCASPDPVNRRGRHELHSLHAIRAVDLRPGSDQCDRGNECRIYYGHIGRGAPSAPTRRTIGWLCGQENWRDASTKKAHRCYPTKRADGRHSFECAYRIPCPERPSGCQ